MKNRASPSAHERVVREGRARGVGRREASLESLGSAALGLELFHRHAPIPQRHAIRKKRSLLSELQYVSSIRFGKYRIVPTTLEHVSRGFPQHFRSSQSLETRLNDSQTPTLNCKSQTVVGRCPRARVPRRPVGLASRSTCTRSARWLLRGAGRPSTARSRVAAGAFARLSFEIDKDSFIELRYTFPQTRSRFGHDGKSSKGTLAQVTHDWLFFRYNIRSCLNSTRDQSPTFTKTNTRESPNTREPSLVVVRR